MLERKMGNLKKKPHNKMKITCLKSKNEKKNRKHYKKEEN